MLFRSVSQSRYSRGLGFRASQKLSVHRNLSALVTCHTLYVVYWTWQSAVFLLNSRLIHFTAAHFGHPFFRSYGVRLPSSLTGFDSLALAYSACPPVSVYGTAILLSTWPFSLRTPPTWPEPADLLLSKRISLFNSRCHALLFHV